ncbi:nucleoside diphosphate-linked moiety X motif 19-like [Branchiostoma floridae]|uniref:Acyl-coenzyme A diphosphatase NUDT19 n=2 Tax=Branchiostoma floridae TaxID=7739 RepID=A0A9J7LEA4_BRAFL|nr:nucleoside diphosphate-linked moiety X motif 19-like [Branchiostoma floridae]
MTFRPLSKYWREAATLILTAGAKNGAMARIADDVPSRFDYRVLMLQRSGKSGFMPNAKVFPGGIVDDSDFSNEWMDIFDNSGLGNFDSLTGIRNVQGRSPMLTAKQASLVPNDVGYRICAIRETFEESGILLTRPWNVPDNNTTLSQSSLDEWRTRVDSDGQEFLRLCQEHRCVPDVWSLHEWSNWLTPTANFRRRYDTIFYMCCLDRIPQTTHDKREMVKAQWLSPSEILQKFRREEHWIPPPQVYELSRMSRLPHLNELHRFSQERGLEGCERWLPVRITVSDGGMTVLPGDDLYPDPPDLEKEQDLQTSGTLLKSRQSTKNSNRLEFSGKGVYSTTVCSNINHKFGHLSPVQDVWSDDKESQ